MGPSGARPGDSPRQRSPRRLAGREVLPGWLAALALAFALIEALAFFFGTPGIGSVGLALRDLAREGALSHDVMVTGTRWLVGWVVGAALGLMMGAWTGRSWVARIAFERFLTLLRAIPVICLVPLSIRFFGLDEVGKYFVVGWAVFFICWLGMHQTAASLPEQTEWRSRSLRLSASQWFYAVLTPHVAPAVHTALRTSLLLGLIVTAVAKLAGVYERSSGEFWSEGLGYRIFRTLDQARDDQLFATIVVFSLMGIFGEALFGAIWRSSAAFVRGRRIRKAQTQILRLEPASGAEEPADVPPISRPPTIEVRDLIATYAGSDAPILDHLTLTVPSGTTTAILGRSGVGKTTLLRAISGFSAASLVVAGEIAFDGRPREAVRIGIIPQDAPVFDDFPAWQNILMGDRLRHGDRKDLLRALATMRQFELGGSLCVMAGSLSGGQRQRLAFATATLNEPSVLLCDEPLSALDAFTRHLLQHFYLRNIRNSRRLTTVWITHNVDEALIVADAIYIMDAGGLLQVDLAAYRPADAGEAWLQSPAFVRARQDILNRILNPGGG